MSQTWWRLAWPGVCAVFIGVGIGRFAYTPMIPALIASGALQKTETAYLGASTLGGYLAGALIAQTLVRWFGFSRTIRWSLALSVFSLAATIPQLGFWWYLPWRSLIGVTGAVLMVLAPSYVIGRASPATRARTGGLIYTGVGFAIAAGAAVVAPIAGFGIPVVWAALTLVTGLAMLSSWRDWAGATGFRNADGPADRTGTGPNSTASTRLGVPALLVLAAYSLDGAGFVPHTIFWADFIARDLGYGAPTGALYWLFFGIGAAFGPITVGILADRIGVRVTLVGAFLVKATAIAVPAWIAPAFLPMPVMLFVSSVCVGALSPGIASLVSARLAELLSPYGQMRAWGRATLIFSVLQAASAYGMSYAYAAIGEYRPLFTAGAIFEATGMMLALLAALAGRRVYGIVGRTRSGSGTTE